MKLVRSAAVLLLVGAICAATVGSASARSTGSIAISSANRTLLTSSTTHTRYSSSTPSNLATSSAVASGRVLVRLKGSSSATALSTLADRVDATTRGISRITHGRLQWAVPKGRSASQFAAELTASGKVEYAVPDYVRQLTDYTPPSYAAPNDPFWLSTARYIGYDGSGKAFEYYNPAFSWWLRAIRAPQAWSEAYTGSDIVGKYPLRASGDDFTVHVLDSGLYTNHEDVGVTVVGGTDWFDHEQLVMTKGVSYWTLATDSDVTPPTPAQIGGSDATETAAHGTCVAAEIGATLGNGKGGVGVGYDTKVVVDKVMGVYRDGSVGIDDGAVVTAIMNATDGGAKVISMSFGGYDYSQAIADAVSYATSHDVVVVAAKGNDATSKAFYPASNAGVVSVGALDSNQNGTLVPADFSNFNRTSLDIMAPGSFVIDAYRPGEAHDAGVPAGYAIWDGTSMATPVAAGAIAWLWRAAPKLSASEIESVVLNSATRRAPTSNYPNGYRMLDMYSAYSALKSAYPLLGKPQLTSETIAPIGDTPVGWAVATTPVRGVTYDVSVNGSAVATATSAISAKFAWGAGDYAVHVAAHSSYNWDDGTAAATETIHVVDPATGRSRWSTAYQRGTTSVSAAPAYHSPITISATLSDASGTPLAGATPAIQSSANGVNWANTAIPITQLPNGVYVATVMPESLTYYRFSLPTTGVVEGSDSTAVMVKPGVYLATPYAAPSISHKAKLAISGIVKPAHGGTHSVQLQMYRYYSSGGWRLYARTWPNVVNYGTYGGYSTSVKLKAGTYRIYAYAPSDAQHSSTTSAARSVLIK